MCRVESQDICRFETQDMCCVESQDMCFVQSQYKVGGLRPPPSVVSFVLALNKGHLPSQQGRCLGSQQGTCLTSQHPGSWIQDRGSRILARTHWSVAHFQTWVAKHNWSVARLRTWEAKHNWSVAHFQTWKAINLGVLLISRYGAQKKTLG